MCASVCLTDCLYAMSVYLNVCVFSCECVCVYMSICVRVHTRINEFKFQRNKILRLRSLISFKNWNQNDMPNDEREIDGEKKIVELRKKKYEKIQSTRKNMR